MVARRLIVAVVLAGDVAALVAIDDGRRDVTPPLYNQRI